MFHDDRFYLKIFFRRIFSRKTILVAWYWGVNTRQTMVLIQTMVIRLYNQLLCICLNFSKCGALTFAHLTQSSAIFTNTFFLFQFIGRKAFQNLHFLSGQYELKNCLLSGRLAIKKASKSGPFAIKNSFFKECILPLKIAFLSEQFTLL